LALLPPSAGPAVAILRCDDRLAHWLGRPLFAMRSTRKETLTMLIYCLREQSIYQTGLIAALFFHLFSLLQLRKHPKFLCAPHLVHEPRITRVILSHACKYFLVAKEIFASHRALALKGFPQQITMTERFR
jgi:hypothetical protein